MASFERKRCLDNIYYLAKQQGKKIGELESAAGVSAGYLSRAIKDDSTSKITAELIAILADILGVSIDLIVRYDLSELSISEKKVLKFIEKIQTDTLNGTLFWDKFPEVDVTELSCYENGSPANCLFVMADGELFPQYNSYFMSGNVVQSGDYFAVDIPNTSGRLFLVKVHSGDIPDTDFYELYVGSYDDMSQEYGVEPLCGAAPNSDPAFEEALRSLYGIVADSCKNIKLSNFVSRVLDQYLNPTVDDDSDNLPF